MLRYLNLDTPDDLVFLYELVCQRYNGKYVISVHNDCKEPPTYRQHVEWVFDWVDAVEANKENLYLIAEHIEVSEDGDSWSEKKGALTFNADSNEIGIFVHNDYYKQGIGTKIFNEFLEAWGPSNEPITANINIDNKPSQKFFEKIGFNKVGHIYKFNN